jgi:hypothetical protein
MGILYLPSSKEITGPWLLGIEELEELNSLIEFIDSKLEKSYDLELKNDAEEDVKKGVCNTLEEALERKEKYGFKQKKRISIHIISNDETRIEDNNLKNILIDSKIKSFSPKELEINLEYGYNNLFSLTVGKSFDGKLKYKVKCFDNYIENEINYKIDNWIEKNQPNKAKQIWNKFSFPLSWFSSIVFLFTFFNIYTIETPSTLSFYKSDIDQLLIEGINETNQLKANELLLKINTNYLPEDAQSIEKVNYGLIKVSVIAAILALIFWFNPRTTIGVGKHKNHIKYYRLYSKIILLTIPALFILPPIVEFIKDLL